MGCWRDLCDFWFVHLGSCLICAPVLKVFEYRDRFEHVFGVQIRNYKIPPASHIPILQPRNSKQVENIRFKQLQSQRLSRDALYNLYEMAIDLPDPVHTIHTHPDLVCVLGRRAVLDEMDRVLLHNAPSPQLLSYDTTFQLGDFYISVLCFRHTLFKEAPVIPAALLLHERKFQSHHVKLFSICHKLIKSLQSSNCHWWREGHRQCHLRAPSSIFHSSGAGTTLSGMWQGG